MPEGQLTETAELSPEQSRAETEVSRDAPEGVRGSVLRRPLGQQDSRFAQRNGGKDSPESGPLAEAPEGQLTQTAELSPEQSRAEQRRAETLQRGGAGAKLEVCTTEWLEKLTRKWSSR